MTAINLTVGDELRRADGDTAKVLAADQQQLDVAEPVDIPPGDSYLHISDLPLY